MFSGYEYEDWLLQQWGLWNRFETGFPTTSTGFGGSSDGGRCEIGDELAMAVNGALGRLCVQDRRLLKRYYVHSCPDTEETLVASAVRRFAWAYESPNRQSA
jgi:hypothetical protein